MTQDMKHNDMKRNNEMRDTVFTTHKHHGYCGRLLRILLLLMVMITEGTIGTYAQTTYTYYRPREPFLMMVLSVVHISTMIMATLSGCAHLMAICSRRCTI